MLTRPNFANLMGGVSFVAAMRILVELTKKLFVARWFDRGRYEPGVKRSQ